MSTNPHILAQSGTEADSYHSGTAAQAVGPDPYALLDLMPSAVVCVDRELRITYANATARALSRMTDGPLDGRPVWDMYPEDEGTALEETYRRVLATGDPERIEHFYAPFEVWIALLIRPFTDGLLLHYYDITVRKETEVERDSATGRMHEAFEAMPDGVVIVDPDWRFSYANSRALELVSHSHIVGHDIFELFPGNDKPPFGTCYRKSMAERVATEFEAFHPEPLNLWLKVQAKPHGDGIILFFSDISERKRAELREQETARRLAEVLEVTSDAVASLDRAWRYTFLNRRAKELVDPGDRLLGKNIWDEFPDAVGSQAWETYHRSMNDGETASAEIFYGPPINAWLAVKSHPTPEGIVVFFRDVTEEKRHNEVLASQQALLATVQAVARVATYHLDLQTEVVTYGPSSYEVYGRPLNEMTTLADFRRVRVPEHEALFRSSMDRAIATLEPQTVEFAVFAPDGRRIWVESRFQALAVDGVVRYIRGIAIDITERKRNEAVLVASEQRYRVLADLNPQAIWSGSPSGEITYANQGFLDYVGFTLDQLADGGWLNGFPEPERERVVAVWTRSVTSGVNYEIDVPIRRASDGAYRWWNLRALPVREERGAILSWLGVGQDIHDARTAAEALRLEQQETERQRAELETIYRTAPIGLSLVDPVEFRFLRLNERAAEILGRPESEVLGRTIEEIMPLPGVLELSRQVARGVPVKDHLLEGELPTRPGEHRYWTVNFYPVYGPSGTVEAISTAAVEITNQKRSEAALIQSEKLAAVGRLASSISHEINNPLEAVTNLLYLVSAGSDLSANNLLYIQMAQSELSRVSQIATQTLRFHRQAVAPTLVTAEELVSAVLNLYQGRLANSGIRVDTRYATRVPIHCFENDIRQVLNNLIANAIDAMRTGGRLVLRAHAAHGVDGEQGVRITVADTGHGMPTEVSRRIFEPFYTTKDLNGTGLGLWISAGIVERHRGRLDVRSTIDPKHHGTVFTLFLPLRERAIETASN